MLDIDNNGIVTLDKYVTFLLPLPFSDQYVHRYLIHIATWFFGRNYIRTDYLDDTTRKLGETQKEH